MFSNLPTKCNVVLTTKHILPRLKSPTYHYPLPSTLYFIPAIYHLSGIHNHRCVWLLVTEG